MPNDANLSDWEPWFAWYPVRRTLTGKVRWLRRVERRMVWQRDDRGVLLDGWWQYRDPLTVTRFNWRLVIGYVIAVAAIVTAGYVLSGAWLGW